MHLYFYSRWVHPCIVQCPVSTLLFRIWHSVHCKTQGCVDDKLTKKYISYICNIIKFISKNLDFWENRQYILYELVTVKISRNTAIHSSLATWQKCISTFPLNQLVWHWWLTHRQPIDLVRSVRHIIDRMNQHLLDNVKKSVDQEGIRIFVETEDNLADPLTKRLQTMKIWQGL